MSTRAARGLTPSQTVGPYFSIGLEQAQAHCLAPDTIAGERIVIAGHVHDGAGEPVPDALLEIWQADASGHYVAPQGAGFRGFGRCAVDAAGAYRFETIKPGASGAQAPHINVVVFARGLLVHLYTRIYFADEAAANARDSTLLLVDENRRDTLVATRAADRYHFDVHLQGRRETVFFDV